MIRKFGLSIFTVYVRIKGGPLTKIEKLTLSTSMLIALHYY